ncbi:MAG: DUF932 domain-containing protein [Deltaproteobacteria bacterium]|nr:DUF932 domain-containing protein [Deltaproteobacteria bacterium]
MTNATLESAARRVQDLASHCHDAVVPVPEIRFDDLSAIRISGERHPLSETARAAVASRLGIPIAYLKKCPPDVQAFNLNHWLEKEPNDKLFLRFDGLTVRAMFTTRYIPVDNAEVVDRVAGLGYAPETPVRLRLDERFMHVTIPDEVRTFAVRPEDRVTPGVSVGNSEVGLSSLTVAAFFLRLVCTNGMVTRTEVGSSYRHLSRKILEEFPTALSRVGEALEVKRGQFRVSLDSAVRDPESTMKSLGQRFLLTPGEQEAATWGFEQEPGATMFHVANGYTKGAQYPGLPVDSSYRLERVGGDVLALAR